MKKNSVYIPGILFAIALPLILLLLPGPGLASDSDLDGMDDVVEVLYGTNPQMATLFVRPLLATATAAPSAYKPWLKDVKWDSFRDYLTEYMDASGRKFLSLAPLKEAKIEIVIIGDPPAGGYGTGGSASAGGCDGQSARCGWFNPLYDPSADTFADRPPTNIVEVVFYPRGTVDDGKEKGVYPTRHSDFHTYFALAADAVLGTAFTWSWDTYGWTPETRAYRDENCNHRAAKIYEDAIEFYIREGYYGKIEPRARPVIEKLDCRYGQCLQNLASPFNLPPDDSTTKDDTVEFNGLGFDSSAKITNSTMPPKGREFGRREVMTFAILHELGHALLNASPYDHCAAPDCVMCAFTTKKTGWDLTAARFGGTTCTTGKKSVCSGCTHSNGGNLDIRRKVMNYRHPLAPVT